MQPGYLPWLGFFELIVNSDKFVVLDTVQYNKKSWRNRNRIRTKDGWMWLTVPVMVKGKFKQLTKDVRINNQTPWTKKHLNSIYINYSGAPFFKAHIYDLEKIYLKKLEYLVDLNLELVNLFMKRLGITTPLIKSSELSIPGKGNEHIINICKRVGADELYDSEGAKAFINKELFDKEDIRITFQDYKHPTYEQVYKPFIPYMSTLDLLFNCGKESLEILNSHSKNQSPDNDENELRQKAV
jgi:hypothetical protein